MTEGSSEGATMTVDEALVLWGILHRACETGAISHDDHTALYLTVRRMYWAPLAPPA